MNFQITPYNKNNALATSQYTYANIRKGHSNACSLNKQIKKTDMIETCICG